MDPKGGVRDVEAFSASVAEHPSPMARLRLILDHGVVPVSDDATVVGRGGAPAHGGSVARRVAG